MNVDDRKLHGARHGRGGGVAGRVAGRGRGGRVAGRGRVRGRTATESSWFGNAVGGPVRIVPLPPLDRVVHRYSSDGDEEEVDDGREYHDDDDGHGDDEEEVDDDGDEPEVYRGGLRREFKYYVDVSEVSFPCKNKSDLLAHIFQAKAALSRRQLNIFTMYVNDPWVREAGLSYENGKQMTDDAPRIFPFLEPVYVKTTQTKIVASKGSVNPQRGEKRTREIPIKVKQYRVPDLVERTIACPKKSQMLKPGVKWTAAQMANTADNGATEYRDTLHAFYTCTQDYRNSDSTRMATPTGEYWVIYPSCTL
jgi:hypothetical protein